MTPLPKRKHSTARSGVRKLTKVKKLSSLVLCDQCGKRKLPHRLCKYCNKGTAKTLKKAS